MPSTSAKQHRFMAAIAHSPSFAKKVGVSQSVGKDFTAADKGKTFNKGGMMKKRRFDEGGEIDYEVDENAEPERRSFGSGVSAKDREYNEPVSKPAKKTLSKSYRDRFPQTEKAAYTPKEPIKQKTPTEQSRADMLQGEAEKRKTKSVPFPTEGFKSKPSTYKTLKEKLAENRDTERGFKKGGMMKESKAMVGKEVAFFKKKGAPASMIKHEKAEMKGYAKGGGIESKGKTQGTMIKMATGGSVSRRADGIAQRGKTKFKNC